MRALDVSNAGRALSSAFNRAALRARARAENFCQLFRYQRVSLECRLALLVTEKRDPVDAL